MSYTPDPLKMARIICDASLRDCRANPNNSLNQWHDGRTTACALMFPDPEIQAAANEVRFLTSHYHLRHYGASA